MNLYHKALLCWSFQRDFDLSKIDSWIGTCRFIIMTCQKQPLPLLQAHKIFLYWLALQALVSFPGPKVPILLHLTCERSEVRPDLCFVCCSVIFISFFLRLKVIV